jgi:hypothetical protein
MVKMKKSKKVSADEEIEKVKDYLLDSKKNIQRMKEGKKARRKVKFIILDNKILFIFLATIIVFSAFTPLFIPRSPEVVADPLQEAVNTTLDLISSNFTNSEGFPIYALAETEPTSELIILSSLTNSMLKQSGYIGSKRSINERIQQVSGIILDDTFREFENNSNYLAIEYQFLGLYSLMQAHYSNKETTHSIELSSIYSLAEELITKYFSFEKEVFMENNKDTVYLIDQAMAIWGISTFSLLTDTEIIGGYNLFLIIQDILESISSYFFDIYNNTYYKQYDFTTNSSSEIAGTNELIFLSLALSRVETRYWENFYFPRSSYSVHQKIINEYVDTDWLVHENNITDNEVKIRNQAFFTLLSFMMRLGNVGGEVRNATTEEFLIENGFSISLDDAQITCESCFYGLISIASEKWSSIENTREEQDIPAPTDAMNYAFYIVGLVVFVLVIRYTKRKRKIRKFQEKW